MGESDKTPRRSAKKARCAFYTRKSSEEGLEQAFNSLDAQRFSVRYALDFRDDIQKLEARDAFVSG
jgi:hypothetical protein